MREALINSPNEMRCKADEAKETRHINRIDEFLSTTQRRKSLVQAINQHFPRKTTHQGVPIHAY